MASSTTLPRLAAALLGTALLFACGGGGSDPGGPAPGADARNGNYTAFATNGERFTLNVDFDAKSFGFKGLTVPAFAATGAFSNDAVAGTHVFQPPANPGNTARFRAIDDLIVGSYNFGDGVKPFVASRRFAKNAQEAAGNYNNLGISGTAAGEDDSTIYTSRINTDNTLQLCADNVIYGISRCPSASLRSYALTMDGDTFNATPSTGTGGDGFSFQVAQAGTSKVYLMSAVNAGTGARFFRIGLPEPTAFAGGTVWGGSVLGEWGVVNYDVGNYSTTGSTFDAKVSSLSGSLTGVGPDGPVGIRTFEAGRAFLMQNPQLAVLVGARNSPAAGYLQIGGR
ncbi:MAG: hypothetical protein ABI919_06425 [Ramlibacter sp.]